MALLELDIAVPILMQRPSLDSKKVPGVSLWHINAINERNKLQLIIWCYFTHSRNKMRLQRDIQHPEAKDFFLTQDGKRKGCSEVGIHLELTLQTSFLSWMSFSLE